MKKNRFKPDPRRNDKQLDKVLIAKIIASVVLISLALALCQRLKRSEYFLVNVVTVRQGSNITQDEKNFIYLKGRNIFDLDLEKEARNVAYYYPSYQKIRITRFFPAHLVVDFLKREPLAVIRSSRNFYIDENLVLFELPNGGAEVDLPIISGVDKYISGAKYGTKCGVPAVVTALNIIKQMRENKVFKGYRIKKLDMSGPDNPATIFLASAPSAEYTKTDFALLEQYLEVKVGWEDTRNKLALLATLLAQVKNNIYNIEYIDLRFKEPVIKFKERVK
jgi:cell division septal protein FtsQ